MHLSYKFTLLELKNIYIAFNYFIFCLTIKLNITYYIIDATNWRSKLFNYYLISIVCINHGSRTKTHWKPNIFPWSWNSAGASSSSMGKISKAVECTD